MPSTMLALFANLTEKAKQHKAVSFFLSIVIIALVYLDNSGNVLAALIGGGITAFASHSTLEYIEQKRIKEQSKQRCDEIIAFCQTLSSEITALIKYYEKGIGEYVSKAETNRSFEMYFPLFSNYFVIFESNTQKLTMLEKNSRDAVIDFYSSARALIDCYKFNNKMCDQMTTIITLRVHPHADHCACDNLAASTGRIMAGYTQAILEYDNHTRIQAKQALEVLAYEEKQAKKAKQNF